MKIALPIFAFTLIVNSVPSLLHTDPSLEIAICHPQKSKPLLGFDIDSLSGPPFTLIGSKNNKHDWLLGT